MAPMCLDKDRTISIKLIRSHIVTADTFVKGHGISRTPSSSLIWHLGVGPKLSAMPSWFKKWRHRMYSVSC